MPTDWLFYWMTLPFGIVIIGLAICLPFGFWRAILGPMYKTIGIWPYAAGYLGSLAGLAILTLGTAYFEFNNRVAAGLLEESQRWQIVPGWSGYIAIISLIFLLPLTGFFGVPISAFLLRRNRLNLRNIVGVLALLWLALASVSWSLPGNEWQRKHRLESFTSILTGLVPGIVLVALPFLVGIRYVAVNRLRTVDANQSELSS